MPIADYIVEGDKFEEDDERDYLCFPCYCCKHRNTKYLEEPCSKCGHNLSAEVD